MPSLSLYKLCILNALMFSLVFCSGVGQQNQEVLPSSLSPVKMGIYPTSKFYQLQHLVPPLFFILYPFTNIGFWGKCQLNTFAVSPLES